MSKRFYVDVDLQNNKLLNAALEQLANDPTGNEFASRMYYNTTTNSIRYYNGVEWVEIGSDEAIEMLQSQVSEISETTDNSISVINDNISTIDENIGSITLIDSNQSSLIDNNENSISDILSTLNDVDTNTIPSIITSVENNSESISDLYVNELNNTNDISTINSEIIDIDSSLSVIDSTLESHIINVDNPHTVTLEQARTENNVLAGDIDMNNHTVTGLANPINTSDAVTKSYADALAQGLNIRDHVEFGTTQDLSATYSIGSDSEDPAVGATLTENINGSFKIDNLYPTINDRILVKNQTDNTENGIYVVTAIGDASNPFILTRSGDFDDSPNPELGGSDYFFIKYGDINESSGWVCKAYNDGDPIVGTDPIIFNQFSGIGTYTAGNGLSLNGTEFAVNTNDLTDTGLEAPTASTLRVVNYTPINNTIVQRKEAFINQSIVANTSFTLNHNFNTDVTAVIYDEIDNTEVGVEVIKTNVNTLTINSNVSFTGTIIVQG